MLVTASCPMDLHNYPMDRQLCSLFIQSFGFSTKSLMFHWSATPLHTRSLIQLSHFTLLTTHQTLCDGLTEDGNFTCLQVDFYLQRHLSFYLLQVYMPSSLVVVMSWLSFWVHPGAVSGRTSLGILTVLTITKQSTMAISSLPKVSYIKAVDVWMAVCLFFVFAAFLQYAVLCVTARAQRHKNDVTSCLVEHPSCLGNHRVEARLGLHNASTLRRQRQDLENDEQITGVSVDQIDRVSRVVFPAVFLLFVLVYFSYFNFDSF
ncbi:hypothetical protein V1264_003810 [Littorina saxatilis]|uniref:Uncharacterized protein n=2 Tax=Littorina saxatilis TaxID=31220 RepID=A0AAN9B0C8_9CAEN